MVFKVYFLTCKNIKKSEEGKSTLYSSRLTVVSQTFCKTETVLKGYVRIHVYMALIPNGVLCTCTSQCTEVTLVFVEWLKGSSWKKKKSDF